MEAVRCSIPSVKTLPGWDERGFLLFTEAGLLFEPVHDWFKEMAWSVAFTRRWNGQSRMSGDALPVRCCLSLALRI
jgi:hypothetical protein